PNTLCAGLYSLIPRDKPTNGSKRCTALKLGDSVIFYHENFKMYITTKLPNPHYSPEVSTKVTLINFTLSPSGLEDQLLGQVVAEERPDLEEAKNQLIISNAKMKQELKEIEDEILFRLSHTEGNPVDNEELIQVLGASKIKAGEIKKTEQDIDATRLEYVPVAVRTQILFFCVSDLSNVDPMYQYSLEWFLGIFMAGIANSEKAGREKFHSFFTFSLYSNVSRSLFEKNKLMFAFLLCARIMMNENKIDMKLSVSNTVCMCVCLLASREPLPGEWDTKLDSFQKLLVLRCLRADCLVQGLQDFVSAQLGQRFVEPQVASLSCLLPSYRLISVTVAY
uniref:Dynein heavy chain ATP-binding dynein motor region domain-containing protein n=1 Tax=Cyclopterus lumpus TaxID=8103 RepID=A0A8C3AHZ6_CYCLU